LKIKRKLAVMLDRQQMNVRTELGIQHQIIAEQIFAQLTVKEQLGETHITRLLQRTFVE
jgi:hypothetical protein